MGKNSRRRPHRIYYVQGVQLILCFVNVYSRLWASQLKYWKNKQHFSEWRCLYTAPLRTAAKAESVTSGVADPDPVGSGFQISLDPDPVSPQIMEQKKECRKGL